MKNFINKYLSFVVLGFSIVFYLLSLLIVKNDPQFSFRWIAFSFHIVSLGLVGFIYLKNSLTKNNLKKTLNEKEIVSFVLVVIAAEIVNLLYLTNYPFVSLMDEVRDGGWDAMHIVSGVLLNIFGYGRYDAHGLIIPTFTSFFYRFLGSSVLTYRLPSALLACADVAAIYLLIRQLTNRIAAFYGALVLVVLPLHMFFARTQVVVSFNSFLSAIILLVLYRCLQKRKAADFIFLGTILGFSFGFHAAVRVMAILVLLPVLAFELWWIISKKTSIGKTVLNTFLIIVFCLVGFGPRLLFSNTSNFFHTSRLAIETKSATNSSSSYDAESIEDKYLKSVMVWIYEPTIFTFAEHKPIFNPILSVFFLIGIGYSVFILRKPFFYVLIYLSVVSPFFLSAITDIINADHRISPLMPVGVVFVGIGIYCVLHFIHHKYLRFGLGLVVLFYLLYIACAFFINRPADKKYDVKDYLSMHVIQFLKSSSDNSIFNQKAVKGLVCLVVSPNNYDSFTLKHYSEQYEYFLPNVYVQVGSDARISDREAYVFKNICPDDISSAIKKQIISCNALETNYECPLNYFGDITIHY